MAAFWRYTFSDLRHGRPGITNARSACPATHHGYCSYATFSHGAPLQHFTFLYLVHRVFNFIFAPEPRAELILCIYSLLYLSLPFYRGPPTFPFELSALASSAVNQLQKLYQVSLLKPGLIPRDQKIVVVYLAPPPTMFKKPLSNIQTLGMSPFMYMYHSGISWAIHSAPSHL